MAEEQISTGIDALVAYLNEHGDTNIAVVASALGVGESAVLEWANVLEKAGIVSIAHRAGKLYLSPVSGGAKSTKETKQAERSTVEEIVTSDIAALEQVSSDLEGFSRSVVGIDTLLSTKYKNVKVILDKLNSIDTNISKIEKSIAAKANYVKDISEKAKAQYESAQKHLASLEGFSIDTNNAKAVAQELKDLLDAYEKNTADLSKSLDTVIYQYRKNALGISRSIKEKHTQLVEVMSFDQKQIREYEILGQDYKHEYASMTRQAERTKRRVLDEIAKSGAEMNRLMEVSNSHINSIKPMVGEIKEGMGGIAELNSNLVGMRKDLAAATKERDGISSELKKIQQQVKEVGPSKKVVESSKEMQGKITSLRLRVSKMRTDLSNMGKKK